MDKQPQLEKSCGKKKGHFIYLKSSVNVAEKQEIY